MKKHIFLFCLLFVALTSAVVHAQGNNELPLILWIQGDLYSVDSLTAPPTQITNGGTISGPELSPDGATIAYKSADQIGLNALNRIQASGKIADFDLPGDIYVLDIATRKSTQIVGQPPDASLLVDNVADKATIRSTPVWSPDGKSLAWTEYAYPGGKPQIVIDTIASTITALASDLNAPLIQGAAPPLRWGSAGIAVNASTDAASEQDFLIYGNDGTLLSSPRIAPVDNDPVLDFVWVESANGAQLGLIYQSSRWILIDPKTGVAQAASELPRLVTASSNTRALRFGVDKDQGYFWEIVGENAAAAGAPSQVTLSPSGRQIAFTGFPSSGAVTIWQDGNTTSIPNTGSNLNELQVGALMWGYTYWEIG